MAYNVKGLAAVQDVSVPEAQPVYRSKVALAQLIYKWKPEWQHNQLLGAIVY